MTKDASRQFLLDLLQTALTQATAESCVPAYLPKPPPGKTIVVGAGKAAAAMARAVENHWPADSPLSGLVVTRYGHDLPLDQRTQRIQVVEASHPVPDAAGTEAAKGIRAMVSGLSADDLVLVLISGGGSALLAEPLPGITIDDKRTITKALLTCGASISEINCVRKHLSAIKGGRLALAAAPARIVTLAISDVPGDELSAIASGPTVADPSTCADALAICARYGITLPATAHELLASGKAETPKPDDPRWTNTEAQVIATAHACLLAAADQARAAGVTPLILGDRIEGEAKEVARVLAGIALSCAEHGTPLKPPCVILSGGETTVTVRSSAPGRGGRNSEFLLALAVALDGHPRIHALAADTDGIDGTEDNAGAIIHPDTLARGDAAELPAQTLLDNNDAYRFFAALGDLIVTGPTRTNVNDFRAILVT